MALKWLKYAYKRQAIGLAPHLYWAGRRLIFGPLEPELLLLPHLCRADAASLDIGANWGAYSQAALGLSASIHCFEPQPALARVLRRGLGRSKKVTVHHVALSNTDGRTTFRVPRNDIGYSTIEPSNRLEEKVDMSRGIESVDVETRRLDSFDIGPVGFMKVDVEGHEQEVLEGARGVLERDHPSLLVEVEERHRPGSVASVVGFLAKLGYEPFIHSEGRLQRFTQASGAGNGPSDASAETSRNLVFVHPTARAAIGAALFHDAPRR